MLNVLCACEESQAVCKAFRELGHEAYSCDLNECSGGHPEWHIQGDARKALALMQWDILIAFPPCTYMTNASAVRMRVKGEVQQDRYDKMKQAREFFLTFFNADVPHIAIENPTPMKICELPEYSQAIQPYMFGHPYSKRTCLWLKNIPRLTPTCALYPCHEPYVNGGQKDKHGRYLRFKGRNERNPRIRSKTFDGVAKAMAEQWSAYVTAHKA